MRRRAAILPDPVSIQEAVDLIWTARRSLVIAGRGARGAGPAIQRLLDRIGAVYLDTSESRGLIPESHPSVIAAMRGTALGEADLVLTVGRRLDFQLAYGSPAVFGTAKFLRIGDAPSELRDNRRGAVEIFATPSVALEAICEAAGDRAAAVDRDWSTRLRSLHEQRSERLLTAMMTAPSDSSGRIHPNRLVAALRRRAPADSVLVADGGDFLSFVRVGLNLGSYLDPGPMGCLGVGVPFGIAASLAYPGRQVLVATGDGAFGFNAIEVDTAVRHGARLVIVVANNSGWQIETYDQATSYGRVVGTQLQDANYAAMANAFGMHGERVERVEELDGALERAFSSQPALVDVLVSGNAVSSDAKSGSRLCPTFKRWRRGKTPNAGGEIRDV